jgi:hypothetical protein
MRSLWRGSGDEDTETEASADCVEELKTNKEDAQLMQDLLRLIHHQISKRVRTGMPDHSPVSTRHTFLPHIGEMASSNQNLSEICSNGLHH